jgi:hypothetical protein
VHFLNYLKEGEETFCSLNVYFPEACGDGANTYRGGVWGILKSRANRYREGGGGGGRDSTIFLVSLAFLVGPVRLKWWGVLYLNFHFLQFAVNSLGGWMCAVGILSSTFYCVL